MPMEIGLWRMDGDPSRVAPSKLRLEAQLQDLIEADPAVLGEPLLIIGREVPTSDQKRIDLLGIDADGDLHVLELKRDRTPRDVVAQTIDYGSWVQQLSNEDIRDLFERYKPGTEFDEAFTEHFNTPTPDDLNTAHSLTVVASELDAPTERIIRYLNESFSVPINVLFFRHFTDDERTYVARTWLIDDRTANRSVGRKQSGTREPWNGSDWYVAFGDSDSRSWDDARTLGFVSAGGGKRYSGPLKNLPVGGRIFVHLPGRGYVGVGTVTGEATSFDQAVTTVGGVEMRLRDQQLSRTYSHSPLPSGEDVGEYVVTVDWIVAVPENEAFWRTGMFANQNVVCKLRNRFTIDELSAPFHLDTE